MSGRCMFRHRPVTVNGHEQTRFAVPWAQYTIRVLKGFGAVEQNQKGVGMDWLPVLMLRPKDRFVPRILRLKYFWFPQHHVTLASRTHDSLWWSINIFVFPDCRLGMSCGNLTFALQERRSYIFCTQYAVLFYLLSVNILNVLYTSSARFLAILHFSHCACLFGFSKLRFQTRNTFVKIACTFLFILVIRTDDGQLVSVVTRRSFTVL